MSSLQLLNQLCQIVFGFKNVLNLLFARNLALNGQAAVKAAGLESLQELREIDLAFADLDFRRESGSRDPD